MENSEIYNELIQVRKISQLTKCHDFTNYNDEDVLFVIAAYDRAIGKWANFSVNKGVLIELLNHINLDAIREEARALRDWLDNLQGDLSKFDSLVLAIQDLQANFDNYYTKNYIDTMYYTKSECDARFQPKGDYLTEHHNTGSRGTTMVVPRGNCVTGLTFDKYGHVLDLQYSPMAQTPVVTATDMQIEGAGLTKNSIYLGENRPDWNLGTVTILYSNGTSRVVTDYTYNVDWTNVNISQDGSYSVSCKYIWTETTENGTTTLEKTLVKPLLVGKLNAINVSNYGFAVTSLKTSDTVPSWRKGTVTASYTQGLANKTVTNGATITSYRSSDSNVISVAGTTMTIIGQGTCTLTAVYSYTEAGVTKTKEVSQTIVVTNDAEYYIYVGPMDITNQSTTNVDPNQGGDTPSGSLKYYAGRQDINNGGIGTVDWETTNTSAFLASSEGISANSIAEIKSALNGTVSVGTSGTGKEEIILVVPTEVANAITSIKTPTDKTIIYDKLAAVNGYTCIFIGEMSWTEIKISIA